MGCTLAAGRWEVEIVYTFIYFCTLGHGICTFTPCTSLLSALLALFIIHYYVGRMIYALVGPGCHMLCSLALFWQMYCRLLG